MTPTSQFLTSTHYYFQINIILKIKANFYLKKLVNYLSIFLSNLCRVRMRVKKPFIAHIHTRYGCNENLFHTNVISIVIYILYEHYRSEYSLGDRCKLLSRAGVLKDSFNLTQLVRFGWIMNIFEFDWIC